MSFTSTSSCTWLGHPVSGLIHVTSRAFHTRFPFGSVPEELNLATYINSPDRSTKSTTSHFNVLCLLVNIGFQVLFHSPPGVLFTFPSRYYALSVTKSYLALGGGPPCFPPDSSCLAVLWYQLSFRSFAYGPFTLFGGAFQLSSAHIYAINAGPQPLGASSSVWAPSLSLAATQEIDVSFSSSGYLDVSVHRVPGVWLCIHHTSLEVHSSRFPHSEISGSKDICSSPKLFAAYHVFHRLLVPRHPPCALYSLTNFTIHIAL